MKLTLNKEYAHRHLFVTVLMAAMSIWFGYDGFVRYPATPAAELYRSIEKSDAPDGYDLDGFKRQKTQTQYGFTALAALAALIVGIRLRKAAKFSMEFDENGFSINGRQYKMDDILEIDHRNWKTKSILTIKLRDGISATLDAWHHSGVKEFEKLLPNHK